MRVRIIGAPDSGNRAIQQIVQAVAPDAEVKIQHYEKDRDRDAEHYILPIRSEPFWSMSIERQPDRKEIIATEARWAACVDFPTTAELRADMMYEAVDMEGSPPPLIITYEALVQHPDAVTGAICKHLGVPVVPCPIDVFDANAQYLDPPQPDAVRTEQPKAQTITPLGFKDGGGVGKIGGGA